MSTSIPPRRKTVEQAYALPLFQLLLKSKEPSTAAPDPNLEPKSATRWRVPGGKEATRERDITEPVKAHFASTGRSSG
jgi:hypothetical protein